MDKELVHINYDAYDAAFSEWCLQVFKKAINDYSVMHRFDKTLGLELTDADHDVYTYTFAIVDKRRFMLAKIKYGF